MSRLASTRSVPIVWNVALPISLDGLLASEPALYALLLLADAVGLALLLRLRRRRAMLAIAQAWTEPLDLETLRQRMRIVEPESRPSHLPQTRELLDELRGRETRARTHGISGVAGSSRRR
jgi:hypothetical protein